MKGKIATYLADKTIMECTTKESIETLIDIENKHKHHQMEGSSQLLSDEIINYLGQH